LKQDDEFTAHGGGATELLELQAGCAEGEFEITSRGSRDLRPLAAVILAVAQLFATILAVSGRLVLFGMALEAAMRIEPTTTDGTLKWTIIGRHRSFFRRLPSFPVCVDRESHRRAY